ncbi:hypothetical protein J2T22_001110 [Pseudarthrobacter defluvii]|uniref:MvaI/BcnI restriction endonuclease domain-containing protein n=1 Tax=Pseudarthrobacter defluvii TaxID=410837 RepID=A0ABT9UE61_9MICC|nr:MvaI/BcnI family restriction endonuclease [Pseudarthrobacter defluvii]MDQ0117937.1 hypothetical protein [Pseudarthrobacter defluvii]
MRELSDFEVENIGYLTRYGLDYGLLEPTSTGLGKSIMDATADYRAFLHRQCIHDFDAQGQGVEEKHTVPATVITADGDGMRADASLYRPRTKEGDPRVWFSKLNRYCDAGDILVSLWAKGRIWVLNATRVRFNEVAVSSSIYRDLLRPLVSERESVFEELLGMLSSLSARGFIPAIKHGDTAVGHLLETELGIEANSRKIPDYKGVELKASRARATSSQTMFARVPDWKISNLKSSREILENFGYERGDDFKLYCTVSSQRFNSQGLKLLVDEKAGLLHEVSNRPEVGRAVTWRIDDLQDALSSKHADTFWIDAVSRREGGTEFIHFRSVKQTTKPIVQQVAPMLAAGTITMDHLIKRTAVKVSEKGPLFKINKKHFDDLFPDPIFHDLQRGML